VKAGIRIRDLLAMRAGMAWDESTYPFSDDRNDAGRLNRSADWIRSALEQPMEATPGTTWRYSSGAAILLSGILLRKTGMDAVAYAVRYLFGPLGITDFDWYRNPRDGLPHTGGGLHLLPRDLARFGQLYLDGGLWKSIRLVPEAWVRESATVRSVVGENGYGYQWWTRPLRGAAGHAPERGDVPFGWGYGGQHVFVSPHLDLVVVVNAWNPDGSSRGPALFDALVETIEP
jgi:CubicO group peptidase (beta-lactamase class C family)